jgi:hypothetical protein
LTPRIFISLFAEICNEIDVCGFAASYGSAHPQMDDSRSLQNRFILAKPGDSGMQSERPSAIPKLQWTGVEW